VRVTRFQDENIEKIDATVSIKVPIKPSGCRFQPVVLRQDRKVCAVHDSIQVRIAGQRGFRYFMKYDRSWIAMRNTGKEFDIDVRPVA
jgi:hypothetical protein